MKDFYVKYWKRRINDYGASNLSGVAAARLKSIVKLLPRDKDLGNVIDVGCGNGTSLFMLKKDYGYKFNPHGVEISDDAVAICKSRGIDAKVADVENNIGFPDNSFDSVICSEVLEHLILPEKALEQIKRVAKKDAIFIFTVPNEAYIIKRVKLLLGRDIFDEGRYCASEHLHFWIIDSFKRFLEDNGFETTKVIGRDGSIFGPLSVKYPSLFSDTIFLRVKLA